MKYVLALMLLAFPAMAQEAEQLPVEDGEFRQVLCQMAVGNVQAGIEERKDLYIELYASDDGTMNTGKSYGLLTGMYHGDRGVSHFGPTNDDPASPRYLSDGRAWTNADAARLRAATAEFRKGACEAPPTVNPQ